MEGKSPTGSEKTTLAKEAKERKSLIGTPGRIAGSIARTIAKKVSGSLLGGS